MTNPFYTNQGPITLEEIIKILNISYQYKKKNIFVNDIKDLSSADNFSISFFHSKKYKDLAKTTKALICITKENLTKDLPRNCIPLIVENVLIATAQITEKFYPDSVNDDFDNSVFAIDQTIYRDTVRYGKNVLLGKNVKIGKNCLIGHNSIIEKNVIIGNNCSIGSNTIVRNSWIKNNVRILDNCVIGKKGFGFFPDNVRNYRYPHIGIVIINDFSEIGCGSTIDRGSISNTIIGKNTFLDNQIHIAHNVKIGDNVIIAGQVGIAGSAIIGSNVKIGGQAGISGHLTIGNNVEIGGGSGVIRKISDNSKVMGYPATNIKNFLKNNK